MATALLYCAVLEDELEALAEGVRWVKMPQGLHNDPPKLRREVQTRIDEIELDPSVDAIVLGYGLCSRGTEGLMARHSLLVLPRAHDCITLLLGSKEAYSHQVATCPGTYWYSPGWNRHHLPPGEERYQTLLAQYREKFDEDDAEYLMEQEQAWFGTYSRAAYVHQDQGDVERARAQTCDCAKWLGWGFEELQGNPDLLRALVHGPWDEDRFVVARPGQTFRMTGDARIVEVVDAG